MRSLLLFFQTAPAGFDFPLVTALTAFISLPVKVLVDILKGAFRSLPDTATPFIGIFVGYAFCLVILVANETPFTKAVYAQCAIAAVGAQVVAMAATWNQNRAQRVNETIQAAIDAPKDTTVAEVKAQVKGTGDGQ